MEKKYYDLIVSLIKKHRKYPGCEAILDDIAEDVYNHAKVVFDTIDNEDVITSYLSKVVSTSIITVPKKLNINTRVAHRVIMPELKEPKPFVKNEIKIDVPAPEKTEIPEFTFEDNTETILQELPLEKNELELENEAELLEPELDNTDTSTIALDDNENEESNNSESAPDTEFNLDEAALDDDESKETNTSELTPDSEFNLDETALDDLETEQFDIDEPEELSEIDLDTEDIVEPAQEEEEEEEEEELPSETIDEPLETDNELVEEPEVPEVNKELVDKMINSAVLEPTDKISEEVEEPVEVVDNTTELLANEPEESDDLVLENDDFTLEELTEAPLLEQNDNELLLEETGNTQIEPLEGSQPEALTEQENKEFTPPSYDKFNFEPEIEPDNNSDEINEALQELDSKHPELHALQICELKYKENKSVEEIAEILGVETDAVIDTLSEIISAIKD